VGARIVELQEKLRERVEELEDALSKVRTLSGLLPICSYCKKIRDDQDYWTELESYLAKFSEAEFSHGVCPGCYETHLKPKLDELKRRRETASGRADPSPIG
jgi:phosphoserine phosphatase RsbU/P